MRKKTTLVVEISPDALWHCLAKEQRPLGPTNQELFEDLVYVSSDAVDPIGGPSISFDGTSISLTGGAERLFLARRLRKLLWSQLTIAGKGTPRKFFDLCGGRRVPIEEVTALNSKADQNKRTILLYRFSRSLSGAEKEEFARRLVPALEYGRSNGHTFEALEFSDDDRVAIIHGFLKSEDRRFGALLLRGASKFDMEVCPILGFKGRSFFNPLQENTR